MVKSIVRHHVNMCLNHQNPRLEGLCSELCSKLVAELTEKGKATRQVGFWMGSTRKKGMNRCHEWVHFQMEGGSTIVFDPTYIQFVHTNEWSWSECKKAVQHSALLFQDDNLKTEQMRRIQEGLPIKLDISDY